MAGNAIPQVQTDDRNLNQAQNNLVKAILPLQRNPLMQGNLLQNIDLTSGSNSVNHGLGRTLVGWFITRLRDTITVKDTQDSNQNPTKTLLLTASGAGRVDLYVF